MKTASPQRTLWLAAGSLLAAVLTLWAGFSLAGWTVGSVERTEHRVLRGEVSEVRIDALSADVTLAPSAGREVVVDSRARGTLWMPKLQTRIGGGHLSVRGECSVSIFAGCSASFVVHVPAGTPVHVRTSSGDVRVDGLDGPVDVKVSSGDIHASRLGGRVELEASSGDIDARELTAPVVNARATSGDVLVDAAGTPERVNAASAAGDVTILVPRGAAYDAQAATSAGDRRLGVRSDPGATRSLTAITSSGDAEIKYR